MRATRRSVVSATVIAAVLVVLIASAATTALESSNMSAIFDGGLDAELEFLMPSETSQRILAGHINFVKRTSNRNQGTGDAGCARNTGRACGPPKNDKYLNNRCAKYTRNCH